MRYWFLAMLLLLPTLVLFAEDVMSPSIQEVKKKHETRLLTLPGVVSVGIGIDKEGNPAIIVGLDESRPETEVQIPKFLEGYPIVVQIIGPIRAQ